MKTSEQGVALLHHYESCKLKAYPDPATGGAPWTIGYGHTGPEVKHGLVWTQEQAEAAFADRLANEFEPGVSSYIFAPITQNQFDAMVCLAYNIGLGNFKASSVRRKHNFGDLTGAADSFLLWNKAAGKVMKGLQRRRAAERLVYLGASASDAAAEALEEYP